MMPSPFIGPLVLPAVCLRKHPLPTSLGGGTLAVKRAWQQHTAPALAGLSGCPLIDAEYGTVFNPGDIGTGWLAGPVGANGEVSGTDYLFFSSLPVFCASFWASRFWAQRTAKQLFELVEELG